MNAWQNLERQLQRLVLLDEATSSGLYGLSRMEAGLFSEPFSGPQPSTQTDQNNVKWRHLVYPRGLVKMRTARKQSVLKSKK
jgi:hypothetical protein